MEPFRGQVGCDCRCHEQDEQPTLPGKPGCKVIPGEVIYQDDPELPAAGSGNVRRSLAKPY